MFRVVPHQRHDAIIAHIEQGVGDGFLLDLRSGSVGLGLREREVAAHLVTHPNLGHHGTEVVHGAVETIAVILILFQIRRE